MKIGTLDLWLLACKWTRDYHVFTVWDSVPFWMGQEYLGISRWIGGRRGFFGQIGLNPGLMDNEQELRHTWLHELGHFVLGHVEPATPTPGVDEWLEFRERLAERFVVTESEKLARLLAGRNFADVVAGRERLFFRA